MQVKILCAVKSTSIPIYVPGVQRVATPANGHRLRCGCRREDAKKRRHPCRSAIPGAFPLDLIGFHVYTFLAGGGWSSCPFSTRLRILKLAQERQLRQPWQLLHKEAVDAREKAVGHGLVVEVVPRAQLVDRDIQTGNVRRARR